MNKSEQVALRLEDDSLVVIPKVGRFVTDVFGTLFVIATLEKDYVYAMDRVKHWVAGDAVVVLSSDDLSWADKRTYQNFVLRGVKNNG